MGLMRLGTKAVALGEQGRSLVQAWSSPSQGLLTGVGCE